MPKKINIQDYFIKAAIIHNNKYDYSLSNYFGSKLYIQIICPFHGSFYQTPNSHLNERGCPKCGLANKAKSLTKSKESFVEKAIIKHGEKYIYTNSNYVDRITKIKIFCKQHQNEFTQSPKVHLMGFGCPKCGTANKKLILTFTLETFIEKSNKAHNFKYEYNETNYINYDTKVNITCLKHGIFSQTPRGHLSGKGCFNCGRDKTNIAQVKSFDVFINEAEIIHNKKYIYNKSIYKNTHTKIEIVCPAHGSFWQRPSDHLDEHGCSRCVNRVSPNETKWLDGLHIKTILRQHTIKINNIIYYVDGFDPSTNTIYEFYGDFWHGNPERFNSNNINPKNKKTYGELYKQTLHKETILKNAGYKVISIWENDFRRGSLASS